jgi:hypothetical protein
LGDFKAILPFRKQLVTLFGYASKPELFHYRILSLHGRPQHTQFGPLNYIATTIFLKRTINLRSGNLVKEEGKQAVQSMGMIQSPERKTLQS